jgi:uncharacterized protein (DUF1330 family)
MILILSFKEGIIFISKMKQKKHNKIVKDYDKQKEKHLERLATNMLKNDEKLSKLKGKNINTDFLNLF